MAIKRLPHDFCDPGAWPRGPFRAPTTDAADVDTGLVAAAANMGRLAAALRTRRKSYRWSIARLAEECGVGQHTIGRIERGRTWPDMVTVARLAHALGMALTMGLPGSADQPATTPGGTGMSAGGSPGGPISLPAGTTTAAQVIDALFQRDPRLASEVSTVVRNRQTRERAAAEATTGSVARRRTAASG